LDRRAHLFAWFPSSIDPNPFFEEWKIYQEKNIPKIPIQNESKISVPRVDSTRIFSVFTDIPQILVFFSDSSFHFQ
jgi:hypothetical protein